MSSRLYHFLGRALEPLAASLWVLFVLWTLIVAAVWLSGFGEAELGEIVTNHGLRDALTFGLQSLDVIWIALAASNGYVALAATEGLATARRWALIIVASAAIIAASSVAFRIPLGPIAYTSGLGPRIGSVPLGQPLCWFVFLVGSRALVLRILPKTNHALTSFIVGVLTTLADINLEPIAWHFRAFWIWYPGMAPAPITPPTQNYATWFIVTTALSFIMRESKVAPPVPRTFPRAASAFLMLNAVFLATHAVRLVRR